MKVFELKKYIDQYHLKKGWGRKLITGSSASMLELEDLYRTLKDSPELELSDEQVSVIKHIAAKAKDHSLSKVILDEIVKALHPLVAVNLLPERLNLSLPIIANIPLPSVEIGAPAFKIPRAENLLSSNKQISSEYLQQLSDKSYSSVTQVSAHSVFKSPVDHSIPFISEYCHLIWLGSALDEVKLARITNWKLSNPEAHVMLWFDPDKLSEADNIAMHSLAAQSGIELSSIRTLENEQNEKLFSWIDKLYESGKQPDHITNYAVMSDILRYLILDKLGGWYVDTDIHPVYLKPCQPLHGFYINIISENDNQYFSPSIIGAIAGSIYCKLVIDLLLLIATHYTDKLVKFQSTKKNYSYITAAINVTGQVGSKVCSKLLKQGKPLIKFSEDEDKPIFESIDYAITLPKKMFSQLTFREKSWYAAEDAGLRNDDLYRIQGERFSELLKGGKNQEAYDLLCPGKILEECHSLIEAVEIVAGTPSVPKPH